MGQNIRTYYAKSENDHHKKIPNQEHLKKVGLLARKFGMEIGKEETAGLTGIMHDFGKYAERFQGVLCGTYQGVDHAMPGAAELYQMLNLKTTWRTCPDGVCAVEAVAGHHEGLTGLSQMQDELEEMIRDDEWDNCPSGKIPSLRGDEEFRQAEAAFTRDFPDFHMPQFESETRKTCGNLEKMLDTRMLFSCLVDADYSVSASDDDPDYIERNSRLPLDAETALKKLEAHLGNLRENSKANTRVNAIRDEVYARCGEAGERPMGLFTLTAPTGVGKTMAMLHFALRHCMKHQLHRIIVVLPLLTLAEQTQKEYQHIFQEILVDHSQQNLPEEARELAARWDSPVVITTSVRFFESLFSADPRNCRKLHHIANSVVLFDEAQSLPASLAATTAAAVNALCKTYRCTMVFSTATQPDFSALPKTDWKPEQIISDSARLFHQMRRVNTRWCHDIPLERVAEQMSQEKNVCCIVNLRRHARKLFGLIQKKVGTDDGIFFLTTDLCPAHRLSIIAEIKRRQREEERCIVVATQCIEAGVDLDFDSMFRAIAPLESVVQAAGRCNRNGKLPGGGHMTIFRPQEDGRLYPGDSYERATTIVMNLWADCDAPELNDLEQIDDYYKRYFSGEAGNAALESAIKKKNYKAVAENYRLIKNAGVYLIVPWSKEQERFQKISDAVRDGCITQALLREAAPITITCYDEAAVRACATPITLRKGKILAETGYFLLNPGFENRYDSMTGFMLEDDLHEDLML